MSSDQERILGALEERITLGLQEDAIPAAKNTAPVVVCREPWLSAGQERSYERTYSA
jgi:hypothetical protein